MSLNPPKLIRSIGHDKWMFGQYLVKKNNIKKKAIIELHYGKDNMITIFYIHNKDFITLVTTLEEYEKTKNEYHDLTCNSIFP